MDATVEVEASAHARLGPSNHRWPYCPGSVREEAAYPDIPGEAAIDGTGSHLLLELCLINGVRAEQYVGQIIGANHPEKLNGWMVYEDRATRVQMCLDYVSTRVKALQEKYPGHRVTVSSETRADPGSLYGRDDWWGTCDITLTVLGEEQSCLAMEVIDYKDGRGWVDAQDNTQLISYLGGRLAFFLTHGTVGDDLQMSICQPKTNPVIRSQTITLEGLRVRLDEMAAAAALTDDPDAPLIPDNKGGKGYCTWCKHKPNCTARVSQSLEIINTMDITPTTPGGGLLEQLAALVTQVKDLPNEKLADLADAEPGIMALFDQVRAEAQARIDAGQEVPGFAMKPGNGRNVWAFDEEEVVKKLRAKKLTADDIYPKKLASPAQILKNPKLTERQRKAVQEELVTYLAGDMKLARVERIKRPDAKAMFAEATATTEPATPVSFF